MEKFLVKKIKIYLKIFSKCDLTSQIEGNLCSSLCSSRNYDELKLSSSSSSSNENDDTYQLVDCYNFKPSAANNPFENYEEYKSVFVFERRTKQRAGNPPLEKFTGPARVVLKSRKKYFLDFDTNLEFDLDKRSLLDQLNQLAAYLASTLSTKFGIEIDPSVAAWVEMFAADPTGTLNSMHKRFHIKDLIHYVKLLSVNGLERFEAALRDQNRSNLARFITHLAILTSQDEYLFYQFFQAKPGTVRLEISKLDIF